MSLKYAEYNLLEDGEITPGPRAFLPFLDKMTSKQEEL